MSQLQSDDRAKLDVLRSAVIEAFIRNPGNDDIADLHALCDKLDSISGNPLPKPAYAVNTSFYGRNADEDHAPKGHEQ